MKITESRLRRIIRGVIKESFKEYDRYQYQHNWSQPAEISDLLAHLGIDAHEEGEKANIIANIACDMLNCSIDDVDLCIEKLREDPGQSYLDFVEDVRLEFHYVMQNNK